MSSAWFGDTVIASASCKASRYSTARVLVLSLLVNKIAKHETGAEPIFIVLDGMGQVAYGAFERSPLARR